MKKSLTYCLAVLAGGGLLLASAASLPLKPDYPVTAVPLTAVKFTDVFWSPAAGDRHRGDDRPRNEE